MNITQEQLKDWSACADGYKWACGILKDKPMDDVKFLKVLMKEDRYDWANWVIVRVMTYDQYVGYAVYAAEQVIDIYEKKYPEDKRPRNAIEAAKKCIGLKGEDRAAAGTAAGTAARAAWAAGDAAWADRAAGAARDAARDAGAAGDAAWAAARAAGATGDATKKQMQIKILEYGLSLLD